MELTEAIKSKDKEAEAYISEIEVISFPQHLPIFIW